LTGDLCWYWDNATLVFGGRSYKLFRDDATGAWKAVNDDGLRIELLTNPANGNGDETRDANGNRATEGEYWKITALDGTQYFYGINKRPGDGTPTNSVQTVPVYGNSPNEPCWNQHSNIPDWCEQGYRFNLDYVVDPRGNSLTYFYGKYNANYGIHNNAFVAPYDMEGHLDHVEYGTRAGTESAHRAPMRVNFGLTVRCTVAGTCQGDFADWPDSPWDQFCGGQQTSCPNLQSPAFWTPFKLSDVTTQVWDPGTNGYRDVDRWNLGYTYPATGDGTSPALFLSDIAHVGLANTDAASEPTLHFDPIMLANRIDSGNGVPPLMHARINWVRGNTGDETQVYYNPSDCSPSALPTEDNNTMRCFRQYAGGKNLPVGWGWYARYTVSQMENRDLVAGSPPEDWFYDYSTAGSSTNVLWHHDDPTTIPLDHPSWSDWRGYNTVTTTHGRAGGPRTVTRALYFRGMDGDRTAGGTRSATLADSQSSGLPDTPGQRGQLRERSTVDGPAVIASTIHDTTATKTGHRNANGVNNEIPALDSFITRETRTRSRTFIAATNTWRWTETDTAYDGYGLATDVKDQGDTSTGDDDRCTHTDYARDPAKMLVDFPSQTLTTDCAASPGDADYLAGTRTEYDGGSGAPTHGLPTKTYALDNVSGGVQTWKPVQGTDYDAYGRTVGTTDAIGRPGSTVYTPATDGPVTQTAVTDAAGFVTTTTLDPAWGSPTRIVDANGNATAESYDALGRRRKVWLGNPGAAVPDIEYVYNLRNDAPSSVVTKKIGPAGTPIASYQIYDGQLRLRQTQTMAPQNYGGRVVNDTAYDTRGLTVKESMLWNSGTPSDSLVGFSDADIARQNRYSYDNLERKTVDALWFKNTWKWQTTTAYDGDRVTTTPPEGGVATTTFTNARGRTSQVWTYYGGTVTPDHLTTSFTYDRLDRQTGVTDPRSSAWTATYDLRGRVLSRTEPDRGTTTRTYDEAGQVLTQTDARNVKLAFGYDALGRKTDEYLGSTSGTQLARWTYDSLAKGLPTSATRYDNGKAYTKTVTGYNSRYESLGTSVTIPATEGFGTTSWTTSTAYNADGSTASVSYPAAGGLPAETVSYTYDSSGLVSTMAGQDTYVNRSLYWYFDGRPGLLNLGSGTKQVQINPVYDETTGWLVGMNTNTQNQADPTKWDQRWRESYVYHNNGQMRSIWQYENTTYTRTECLSYDTLAQLYEDWTTNQGSTGCSSATAANVSGPDSFWTSYRNSLGRRATEIQHLGSGDVTRAYTYGANGQSVHELSTITTTGAKTGTDTYTYDSMGDTLTRAVAGKPTQTLTWDSDGHLATVTDSGGASSYTYDADGTRLLSRDPGGATVYLDGTEVHHDAGGASSATRYYTFAGMQIAARTTSGGLVWLATDHQGTNQVTVNPATLAVTHRRSDVFGNPVGTQAAWPTTRGFVGGTKESTGLVQLGAREYDPATGRFASVDPVVDFGDVLSLDGYAYADNNPGTLSDPAGTCLIRLDDRDGPCADRGIARPTGPSSGGHTYCPANHCGTHITPPPCPANHCGSRPTPSIIRQTKIDLILGGSKDPNGLYDRTRRLASDWQVDWDKMDMLQFTGLIEAGCNPKVCTLEYLGAIKRLHHDLLVHSMDTPPAFLGFLRLVGLCGGLGAGALVTGSAQGCVVSDTKGFGAMSSAGAEEGPMFIFGAGLSVVVSNGDLEDQRGPFKNRDVASPWGSGGVAYSGGTWDLNVGLESKGVGLGYASGQSNTYWIWRAPSHQYPQPILPDNWLNP
jgi:RHS repeat-associated protein